MNGAASRLGRNYCRERIAGGAHRQRAEAQGGVGRPINRGAVDAPGAADPRFHRIAGAAVRRAEDAGMGNQHRIARP